VSVDGTDFRIKEPHPFSRANYSYKFNGPGIRYEVAVCIRTGDIVWVNGLFQPGLWPDIKIFRLDLAQQLLPGERVEADKGYLGEYPGRVKTHVPNQGPTERGMHAAVAARHETCNERFKRLEMLNAMFRVTGESLMDKHCIVLHAAAVLIQLEFENGSPLYSVDYVDIYV
jgi:DDE superfamily endonuclease